MSWCINCDAYDCEHGSERVRSLSECVTELEGAFKACLTFLERVQFHKSVDAEDFGRLIPYWRSVVPRQDEQVSWGSGSSVGALCGENIAPADLSTAQETQCNEKAEEQDCCHYTVLCRQCDRWTMTRETADALAAQAKRFSETASNVSKGEKK